MEGMGYRGKVAAQSRARELRAQGWTYKEIVEELGVSRSSVSLWVRDVDLDEEVHAARARANYLTGNADRSSNKLARARRAEIERLLDEGKVRIGRMTEQEFLVAGTALYAGEGAKTDGVVKFANSDPRMIAFFCAWLRHFFEPDERRLRLRLYLHQGLDLEVANAFWAALTSIPTSQFGKPYRAVPDPSIRRTKHVMGCATVCYSCATTHRRIMGLVGALLSCQDAIPG
jgi:transcriptional regulator with XRE-family HTH domain